MSELLVRERSRAVSALLTAGLLGLCWAPTVLAGGASKMPPLWFFLPILLAGVRFGLPGAAVVALLSAGLAGPATPDDVARHIAQSESDWFIRGGFFLGIGVIMASVTQQLQREARENRRRTEDAQAMREQDARTTALQREFSDTLQIARTEDEAYGVIKRHVQRSIEASRVVILNRNNSDNRLEAMTALQDGPEIATRLVDAAPEGCLAVRFGRLYEHDPADDPLLTCEVCGGLPGRSACVPALVGGRVIGSVLVEHPAPLDERGRRLISESVSHAAPVLANLRSRMIAETRAATDALTGLPNRRTADDSLKRLVAQSGRSLNPLSIVLIDLDHFKRVNDRYGHGRGDELLASVGAVLASETRAGDLAARYGGEEFLVLLPNTDAAGAAVLAEKLRAAIEALTPRGMDAPPTASFGIATLPDHATDPETLVRQADRALYRAKEGGRNRVELCPRAIPGPPEG